MLQQKRATSVVAGEHRKKERSAVEAEAGLAGEPDPLAMSDEPAQATSEAPHAADDRALKQEHLADDTRSSHGEEVGEGAAAEGLAGGAGNERDVLEAYTFGRTPALKLGEPVGEGRAAGSGDGIVVRSGHLPEQRVIRPTLSHRPSSLVSRLSSSSTGSAGAPPAPRPYALPPGLAARSPVPPPSLSSAASISTITRQDTSQLLGLTPAYKAAPPHGQPRSARITYEPPIPLDVQLLLLTTPPPPQRKRVVITAPPQAGDEAAAAERARRARERDLRDEKSLVRRVKAFRIINDGVRNLSGRRGSGDANDELPMAPLKGSETLDLNRQRRESADSGSRRTGKIDSHTSADFVPKTWKDFEQAYAAGQLDIEDPPFPPISPSSSISTAFPSRGQPVDTSKLSPYEAGHFPAPLHLSPVTHIRERVIAQLDLLGETYLLPGTPAPTQPPSFAASFGPSAGSSVESWSSGHRDSLTHFTSSTGSGRRESNASTAPSTVYSHSPAKSQHPFAAPSVFPTYGTSHASPPVPMYSNRGPSSFPASPVIDGLSAISLRNHPTLVSLLHRALYAPLGSPALFKPAPKAAIITLFPSSSSPSSSVTLLESVNLPARVTSFPITHALDAHVLLNGERGLVIADTERDWRWRHNEVICSSASNPIYGPSSAAKPGLGIRFYAGELAQLPPLLHLGLTRMPIFAPSLPNLAHLEEEAGGRIAIGTIALLDDWPRMSRFGSSEKAKLRSLASEITREIEHFLREREKHNFARRGSVSSSGGSRRPSHAHSSASAAAAQQASANMGRTRSDSHAKKVSFDAGAGGYESGYVDYNSVSRRGSVDERDRAPTPAPSGPLPDPPASSPLSSYGLPPMLASTPAASIFAAACTSLADKLDLALVYLVSLDLSSCPPAPSVAGSPSLELIAAHNLPPDANASFDPSLHLRALRAPEGGLLYRSPAASSSASPAMREAAKGGFASGILLPVAEVESPSARGWVLAGYTTDRKRRWGEGEMSEFEKVREQLAKVVLYKEAACYLPSLFVPPPRDTPIMADFAGLPPLQDDQLATRTRRFTEFLDLDAGSEAAKRMSMHYRSSVKKMLDAQERRLVVNLDDLRDYDREFCDGLLKEPAAWLPAADAALKDMAVNQAGDRMAESVKQDTFYVGFKGSFGEHHTTPRTLRSDKLGKMVCMEGIVTRCNLVRPKMQQSVHYCPTTTNFHTRLYTDRLSSAAASGAPVSSSAYPQTDADGNPLEIEHGLSTFMDHQMISIQEMPERAPAGQLPRSVEVVMEDDLVDRCKPGDRLQIVGVYRSLGGGASGSAHFKTLIVANHVVLLSAKAGAGIAQQTISTDDEREIRKVAKRKDVYELLWKSLAPSIYGSDYIKQAILLLLLGGVEKNLPNGTHLRGDINVLMVGDPSTAKSQMLRFVLNTAPLAIATTGRGSSGVGLTAAVTTDKETGERRLEAGAMVLADRGVVCIDEFDKMSEVDRVAIHETVTIAKAGIHTSLNARCSVVAAANPIYGQYDVHKDPHKNIALPDSLLSRFDLLFIVTDEADEQRDRQISEHVLRMHRYVQPGLEPGAPAVDSLEQHLSVGTEQPAANAGGQAKTSPFEKYNELLHGGIAPKVVKKRGGKKETVPPDVLTIQFVKKYIQFAKSHVQPVLTPEASECITKAWTNLRNDDAGPNQKRTSPMTVRALETLIRLSTAHAKARLSPDILIEDAEAAEEILRYALYKEVVKASKPKSKRRRLNKPKRGDKGSDEEDSDEDEGESSSDDEDDGRGPKRMEMPGSAKKRGTRANPARGARAGSARAGSASPSPAAVEADGEGDWMMVEQGQQRMNEDGDEQAAAGTPTPPPVPAVEQAEKVAQAELPAQGGLEPARFKLFQQRLAAVRKATFKDQDEISLGQLMEPLNADLAVDQLFGRAEVEQILEALSEQDDSVITFHSGVLYF
ncbi:DNA replication licensing factor MCM3 [Rhodotorula toruloides]|nr:DNA replication licensing factor MCM3 [Rhodotorula toruloides]